MYFYKLARFHTILPDRQIDDRVRDGKRAYHERLLPVERDYLSSFNPRFQKLVTFAVETIGVP
jgi:hypothetical protein